MQITAYMDESGTHGSETTLISAFAANQGQWREFEKQARRLFAEYKVSTFHAKEWQDGHGDFAGWTMNKKGRFLDDFGVIINTTTEVGCTAILKMSDYRLYYDDAEQPKRLPRDTSYGVCFRAALSFIVQAALTRGSATWKKRKKRCVSVVAEQGHKNAGDAMRLFDLFKRDLRPEYEGMLGELTFATKDECLPLAACDVLAYGTFRLEEGLRPKLVVDDMKSDKVYGGNFYRLAIEKESLITLKRDLMRDDELLVQRRRR